jgi:hypothetical protein
MEMWALDPEFLNQKVRPTNSQQAAIITLVFRVDGIALETFCSKIGS